MKNGAVVTIATKRWMSVRCAYRPSARFGSERRNRQAERTLWLVEHAKFCAVQPRERRDRRKPQEADADREDGNAFLQER